MPEETRVNQDNSRELACGDCVAIFTPNDPAEVQLVLDRLGVKNLMIAASGARKPNWFSDFSSVLNILTFGVELRSPVTKAMIGHLSGNCADVETKRRLQEFISREGKEEFRQLLQKQVSFVDLLTAFEKLNLNIEILTYLRRLQRRWYSIANFIDYRKACDSGRLIKLAFTQISSPKSGLMTSQLSTLCETVDEKSEKVPFLGPRLDRVILHCRDPPPNNFRIIENPKTPILLIAAGSGIAPFIGFLERWELIGGEHAELIYGCRDENSFLYKEKLEKFKVSGVLKALNVAFSRIEPKKYVQDVIRERTEEIEGLVKRNGIVYICGDAAGMGLAIRNIFSEIFGKEKYFELCDQKRIREDLWR